MEFSGRIPHLTHILHNQLAIVQLMVRDLGLGARCLKLSSCFTSLSVFGFLIGKGRLMNTYNSQGYCED